LKSKPALPEGAFSLDDVEGRRALRAYGVVVVADGRQVEGGVTVRDGDDELVGGPMLDHQQRGPRGLAPRASLSSQLF